MKRWRPLYLSKHYYKIIFFLTLELTKKKSNMYFSHSKVKSKKNMPIIFDKSSTLTTFLVNKYIYLYKGKLLRELFVPTFSVGFKIGEFAMTRKPFHFTQKIKKKKK